MSNTARVLASTVLFCVVRLAAAQPTVARHPGREIGFKIVSAELTRFVRPIRIGIGKQAISYEEALVLKLEVSREEYDSLPPDIEPFFYVGSVELRTFHIDRRDDSNRLVLTFHAPHWTELREGASMVLTTEHAAPAIEPERFQKAPRFSHRLIVDRRK
jgi:hypothetical protein